MSLQEFKIETLIQADYGKGKQWSFDVNALPLVGDEIWIDDNGRTISLTVCRVIHQVDNNRVIIQCPQGF